MAPHELTQVKLLVQAHRDTIPLPVSRNLNKKHTCSREQIDRQEYMEQIDLFADPVQIGLKFATYGSLTRPLHL